MPAPAGASLLIRRPDDMHLHLRDGAAMAAVLEHSARQFARAIVMPNLRPPVRNAADAAAYRDRIRAALSGDHDFQPLMTLYLTETTTAREIEAAKASGIVFGVKLYPAGATTNSDAGVRSLNNVHGALAAMEECGLPLLVHGESIDPAVDVFDRERVFLEQELQPVIERYPRLRISLEHISTADGIDFVLQSPAHVVGTLTAHHLLLNRNALFQGGLQPHHYCLPVLKRERHRLRLLEAAFSANPKFFAGTDSAPHARRLKEAPCGCAGIYTAHAAVELYAEIFDQHDQLERLNAFLSEFGARFYGLPLNEGALELRKEENVVPVSYDMAGEELIPLRAGASIAWTCSELPRVS